AERQPLLEVVGGGDHIAAIFNEEVGPGFEPVVVDRLDVAREQVLDSELHLDVHAGARPCSARTEPHPPFLPAQPGTQAPIDQGPRLLPWVPAFAGTNARRTTRIHKSATCARIPSAADRRSRSRAPPPR